MLDLLNDPNVYLGVFVSIIPVVMGLRARRFVAASLSIILCGLGGLTFGVPGVVIMLLLMMCVMVSFTYTNAQDPFLSRKSIEEVEFNETNFQYIIRQMASIGNNLRWFSGTLWRNKMGFVGFLGLLFFLGMITIGTQIVEYEATTQYQRRDLNSQSNSLFQAPSKEFPLGLDRQGRDILSHIVHGGRTPIVTSIQTGVFSTLIAVSFGALAALIGGYVDMILTSLADLVLTIPNFPLLLVLASIFTLDDNTLIAAVLASLTWPPLMRSIRAQVLSLKEREYIEAAYSLDLGLFHIITREVLPNIISYIAINFIFAIRLAMYSLVGLMLLGMLAPREPDWGTMLWQAQLGGAWFNQNAVMLGIAPIVAIALFQFSLILFARSLEEVFNPRLRTG